MNRKQRRATKARARKEPATTHVPEPNIVAAHEAGHAIARYLTAAEMGYSPEEAITIIEVAPSDSLPYAGTSFDGRAQLYIQATTFGPMLTKDMDHVAKRLDEHRGLPPGKTLGGREGFNYLSQVVAEARADGVDIELWLQARALIAVMGPAVEACLRGEAVADMLESYESGDDVKGFAQDCMIAQVPTSEISPRIDAAVKRAIELLSDRKVVDAVNALGAHLLHNGTTDGKTVARIIDDAMGTEAV